MPENRTFQRGDRVRHAKRPEWGEGLVERCEQAPQQGQPAQRLVVTFEHQGRMTLHTAFAQVVPASTYAPTTGATEKRSQGWLGSLEERTRPDDLSALPDDTTDPFSSLRSRLDATLDLYRFGGGSRAMIDWAIGQTGLDDPMSAYARDELEEAYQRFQQRRDRQLRDLVRGLLQSGEQQTLEGARQSAEGAARRALQKAMDEVGT